MNNPVLPNKLSARFRGFLPVVVDVETGGFNPDKDALLEIAAVLLTMDEEGMLQIDRSISRHIEPFPGANMEAEALSFTGIDPYHPFRNAQPEHDALTEVFAEIRKAVKAQGCNRAILVGHNASFDLSFINTAVVRCDIKRNPFHPFSSFDTATMGGVAYGQTVLARAVMAAGLDWDNDKAHAALYDAERTAALFCRIVNDWTLFQNSGILSVDTPA